ncbi:DNA polymerase [Thermodesulfobacteriota bacterium]
MALAGKINELKHLQGAKDFIGDETARSYIDGFYGRFPKVKIFFNQEWEKLKKIPVQEIVVPSLIGRARSFPRRPTAEVERQFRVTWLQQIEADLIKTSMVKLDGIFRRRNMKPRIVMMIHDALRMDFAEEEAEEVRSIMRSVMTTTVQFSVPLETDLEC